MAIIVNNKRVLRMMRQGHLAGPAPKGFCAKNDRFAARWEIDAEHGARGFG